MKQQYVEKVAICYYGMSKTVLSKGHVVTFNEMKAELVFLEDKNHYKKFLRKRKPLFKY